MSLFWKAAKGIGRMGERAVHHALDQRGEENRRKILLGQLAARGVMAELDRLVAQKQYEFDQEIVKQRAAGHNVPRAQMWTWGSFDGHQALVRYQLNGELGRMDILYGGVGTPDGDLHGHVVARHRSVEFWALPGANGSQRVRVV